MIEQCGRGGVGGSRVGAGAVGLAAFTQDRGDSIPLSGAGRAAKGRLGWQEARRPPSQQHRVVQHALAVCAGRAAPPLAAARGPAAPLTWQGRPGSAPGGANFGMRVCLSSMWLRWPARGGAGQGRPGSRVRGRLTSVARVNAAFRAGRPSRPFRPSHWAAAACWLRCIASRGCSWKPAAGLRRTH